MERIVNPTVQLKNEEQIFDFFNARLQRVWKDDYTTGSGLTKHLESDEWSLPNIDHKILDSGYNTRVIAFYYDPEEAEDEIEHFTFASEYQAKRHNLRIGIVTDGHLIKKMKKKEPKWFFEVGLNALILQRYDGELEKIDLSSAEHMINFPQWISTKSTKVVDELNNGALQLMELQNKKMFILFVDLKNPETLAEN